MLMEAWRGMTMPVAPVPVPAPVPALWAAMWLVIAAVISSAITAFFYMRLIVLMFFREPEGSGVVVVESMGPSGAAIVVAVFVTVALGVLPQAVIALLGRAAMLLP